MHRDVLIHTIILTFLIHNMAYQIAWQQHITHWYKTYNLHTPLAYI